MARAGCFSPSYQGYLHLAMGAERSASRRVRFFLIERVLLPVALPLWRLLARTWRLTAPDPALLRALAAEPRLVLLTYHGMLLHLFAFVPLTAAYGRRVVVMLSPSLDGRLLAATLAGLGVGHVRATAGSRGVAGSLEFLRRVAAGDVGVIAADGPLGPREVVKPGVARIAADARARVVVVTTSASAGLTFGSWDRAHLPAPFARVAVSATLLPADADLDEITKALEQRPAL